MNIHFCTYIYIYICTRSHALLTVVVLVLDFCRWQRGLVAWSPTAKNIVCNMHYCLALQHHGSWHGHSIASHHKRLCHGDVLEAMVWEAIVRDGMIIQIRCFDYHGKISIYTSHDPTSGNIPHWTALSTVYMAKDDWQPLYQENQTDFPTLIIACNPETWGPFGSLWEAL